MLPNIMGEFRVAADPDLRFTPSGVAVGKVRAVASKRKQNDQGEWVDDKTCWVNLVGFKKVAENMAESFVRGDLVVVTGQMQTEDWEDKDGNKRTSVEIVVSQMGPSIAFNPARTMKAEGSESRTTSTPPDPANNPWEAPNQDDAPPF